MSTSIPFRLLATISYKYRFSSDLPRIVQGKESSAELAEGHGHVRKVSPAYNIIGKDHREFRITRFALVLQYLCIILINLKTKAGYTAIQSRTVEQEQCRKNRLEFRNVTDGPTDGPTDRPTKWLIESRSTRLVTWNRQEGGHWS